MVIKISEGIFRGVVKEVDCRLILVGADWVTVKRYFEGTPF